MRADRLVLTMDGSTRASTAALLARGPAPEAAGHGTGKPGAEAATGRWQVLAARTDIDSRGQARVLLRLADDMLYEIGGRPDDIMALVAGIGPGTFTGVRIAVATTRALALALGVPVVGVSTLGALASEAAALVQQRRRSERPAVIVPVVDARRGQVFHGIYRLTPAAAGSGGRADSPEWDTYRRTTPFGVCDRAGLGAYVAALADTSSGERVLVAGEVEDLPVVGDIGLGISFLPLEVRAERLLVGQGRLSEPAEAGGGFRLWVWMDDILARRFAPESEARGRTGPHRAGEPGSPESVKPIYVRSPDADIHITKMRDPWAERARDR
jgi:tRNA threonylcarbamoyladenosine biosynthesis protein TsaB